MKHQLLTILVALCALAGTANKAMAETVTYTLNGDTEQTGTVNFRMSVGDSSTPVATTTWAYATATSASVTDNDRGINLRFGTDKTSNGMAAQGYLQIQGSTSTGAYITLEHSSKYIYHVTLKYDNQTIEEAWNMTKSYTYRANEIRLKTIVVEYATAIPFTDAVISGIDDSYVVSDAAVEPVPTVTWHGTTLTSGTHYTVSYQNNSAAGTATVFVTGKTPFGNTQKSTTFNLTWAQYTVRFNKNDGGSPEATSEQSFYYTEEKALAANAFSREDYVFSGWSTAPDGSVAYTDGQSVSNLTATNGDVIDLYAQWRQVGGSCGPSAHWSYDDNGTLSITGTGEVTVTSEAPWDAYEPSFTTVSIGDGITSIGDNAFLGCRNLTTVTGGNDLIYVGAGAFMTTQWETAARASTSVVYLGHVAYCGSGVSGDVTLADGTIAIDGFAFSYNLNLTSVTIPPTVTSIGNYALQFCSALTTVNVLGTTPPTLGREAFILSNSDKSLSRTFNVRSAAYKTTDGWTDIYNKVSSYSGYTGTEMRVVSTLALPDGVTASAADDKKVTILGTTYYAEQASVTLTGLGAEHDAGGITYRSRATVTYNTDQTLTADADASGQASFTMPAADATVTTEDFPYAVKYIDDDGTEKTCTDFTVVGNDYEFGTYGSGVSATLGVSDGTERWYVVVGTVNVDKPLRVQGKARIILCDGAALRVNADYSYGNAFYSSGSPLTIYGQSQATGTLSVTNTGYAIAVDHDLTINGGTVIATATGDGIYISDGHTLTINRGTVTATGAIGIDISQATLTQNGGTLTATGSGSDYAGIYADGGSKVSTVNILGGILNATGTDGAYGIRAYKNAAVTLGWTNATDRITATSYGTVNGGTISVKSGQTLYDGTTAYDGTLDADQLAALAGKTLFPLIGLYTADGTAILLDDDSTQPEGYKNEDRIIALAATAGPGMPDSGINIMLMGRTLYRDGEWNTLCLPFQVNLDSDMNNILENEDHIFHGATVMELNTNLWFDSEGNSYVTAADGRHRSGEVDADGSLHLYFSKVMDGDSFSGYIAPGRPYIVKWGTKDSHPATNIVNPVFQDVNFTFNSLIPRYYSTDEGLDDATGLGNVTMRGTFAPKDYAAANHSILFLGENNTLYYPEAGAHIGPFRAYFELGNGLTVGEPASDTGGGTHIRAFNLSFGEGSEETGIREITDPTPGPSPAWEGSAAWYTLDGVRLNGKPTKKGLYIHGGKKVVIP